MEEYSEILDVEYDKYGNLTHYKHSVHIESYDRDFGNEYNFKYFYDEHERLVKAYYDKDEYTVSCQPAIWKKEFLKECIGTENYNAWICEGVYIYSKK